MNLLIGADPEVFVRQGDKFISGHIFPCGTKEKPVPTKNGSVQVDGLALEFNVKPSARKVEFIRNVRSVYRDLEALVAKQDKTCSLVAQPTVSFGSEYIQGLPQHVQELGCNPDFNAYTESMNHSPNAERPFRTGAGHVHFGWGKFKETYEHFMDCCSLVRELDFYLGLPSLDWDNDSQRRELYGKAGAFRPKLYGLEYRVLSNAWITDDKLIGVVFDQSRKAFSKWQKGGRLFEKYGPLAQEIIDTSRSDWRSAYPDLAAEIF